MEYVVLMAFVLQACVGLKLLTDWWRKTPPTRTAFLHAATADAALILWIVSMVTDKSAFAWTSLGVILVGNFLGDLLLIAHWRGRTGDRASFFKAYGAAAMSLVRGQHPRFATLHAAGAGILTLLVLVGAILS